MGFKSVGIAVAVVLAGGVFAPSAFAERLYTSYNMWYEKPEHLYAINYKKGIMIPAGAEVSQVDVTLEKRRSMITFTTVKDGQTFRVEFEEKFHPGLSAEDYKKKMFSSKTFDELTKGMEQKEIQAIKEGKLVVGMSKAAVIVAYGYPPEHVTNTLDAKKWTYWIDRFRSKEVFFDDNNRTRKADAATSNDI